MPQFQRTYCMLLFYPAFCWQDMNLTLSFLSIYSSTNLHNSDQLTSTVKSTQEHNAVTARSDLFHHAVYFSQLFWPSSGRDKVQVQKENCCRGGLLCSNFHSFRTSHCASIVVEFLEAVWIPTPDILLILWVHVKFFHAYFDMEDESNHVPDRSS